MPEEPRRIHEVRLIVLVTVTLDDPHFLELLAAAGGKPVAEVVASEVVSNLESVPYVLVAIASAL